MVSPAALILPFPQSTALPVSWPDSSFLAVWSLEILNIWRKDSCVFIRTIGNWRYFFIKWDQRHWEAWHVIKPALWDSHHQIQYEKRRKDFHPRARSVGLYTTQIQNKWRKSSSDYSFFFYPLSEWDLCLWRKAMIHVFHSWCLFKIQVYAQTSSHLLKMAPQLNYYCFKNVFLKSVGVTSVSKNI